MSKVIRSQVTGSGVAQEHQGCQNANVVVILRSPAVPLEEAGPSPIRAARVWAQDDSERQRHGQNKKHRRAGTKDIATDQAKRDPSSLRSLGVTTNGNCGLQ
jgi:hypothetical protein